MARGTRSRLHKPVEATTRRSKRRGQASQEGAEVPEVFQDLLHGGGASKTANEDARPLKRRKTTRQTLGSSYTSDLHVSAPEKRRANGTATKASLQSRSKSPLLPKPSSPRAPSPGPSEHVSDEEEDSGRVRQTIIDSDESDESDMEWEDALADGNDETEDERDADGLEPEIGDVAITFNDNSGEEKNAKKKVRRRAITSVDKKRRLDIHKMHVLCLLYHIHRRNAWCNDRRVHAIMRKLPSPKILSNLVPDPEISQYQASKRFVDGMNELKMMWSKRFSVTAQGMYKPRWAEADAEVRPFSDFDELDDPMDLDDFRTLAAKLEGSQDVGTQLFCALLRAIGIETRLVCSLQCLPFASSAQPATPQKPSTQKNTVVLDPYNTQAPSPSRPRARGAASRLKRPSRLEQALGESHPLLNASSTLQPRKKYHTPYPVYWVEAFNSAHQKWLPIDVLSTFTVNSPEKLEPPLSFPQNSLTYAIAFDDDYTAKDVTQRYTKAYNAKTRKFRVESTPHGDKWWKQTMKFFQRSRSLDRDQLEDAALARKTAGEGIPKNVQDFKDHPVYVLERHLRHNEVIHPKTQVGKVNVGTSMNPKMELIYRRGHVHVVRSADRWYRMGRDVQDGEQPLKHAKPKKTRRMSVGPDDIEEDQQEEVGAGLYAEFQTELYVPPSVVGGRVPRNAYGNLDLYVPSMCPPGGTHIRHKLAAKAARIVGVDYAEAVTGFNFKGRHGTAVVQGVVVSQDYAEAVEKVIDGMIYAQEEAENSQRKSEALRLWRRFYLGLRIAQRVNDIEIDGQKGHVINVQEEIEKADKAIAEKDFAGGFFPDEGETTQPTGRSYEPPDGSTGYSGGFMPDDNEDDGGGDGFLPDVEEDGPSLQHTDSFGSAILSQRRLRPQRTNSLGGGFVIEEDDFEDVGGFIRDSSPEAGPSTRKTRPIEEPVATTDTAGGFIVASLDTTVEATNALSIPSAPVRESPPPSTHPQSSPSDVDSLPIEDPEDEDADPDWLVDAT
ncbi:Rad4-domain-containing protein [Massarina eburnea CBS 473.64]|uniref:Rad4-domain-containing protein n=1 Tax=Massarina eburnea CBS 473.64 TaxID=1395130 RepID=A0A6A6S520_9PLEO|nr:Rad4-domain-containing protein [Massarina eburnea CBS 473.64]